MKLKTIDVMNFLKSILAGLLPADAFYCEVLDIKKEKALAVYRSPIPADFGRFMHDIISQANFSIRLRGGKDAEEAEALAFAIYEKLAEIEPETMVEGKNGKIKLSCVTIEEPEPSVVGRDNAGVVEHLIETQIYYFK